MSPVPITHTVVGSAVKVIETVVVQFTMVIKEVAVIPGKLGSDAVIFKDPVPLVAVNIVIKLPEASVVVEGAMVPRDGLLIEKLTIVPAGAGFPFINT
ncbi:hypothetical protein [Bacillus cereus]|uniref:hypothetical protein n=1 Tax=Bacillus cereus TaxID=1396 RepID=UPI00398182C3